MSFAGILYVIFIIWLSNTPMGADFAVPFGLVAWIPAAMFFYSLMGIFGAHPNNFKRSPFGPRVSSAIGLLISLALFYGLWIAVDSKFGN